MTGTPRPAFRRRSASSSQPRGCLTPSHAALRCFDFRSASPPLPAMSCHHNVPWPWCICCVCVSYTCFAAVVCSLQLQGRSVWGDKTAVHMSNTCVCVIVLELQDVSYLLPCGEYSATCSIFEVGLQLSTSTDPHRQETCTIQIQTQSTQSPCVAKLLHACMHACMHAHIPYT